MKDDVESLRRPLELARSQAREGGHPLISALTAYHAGSLDAEAAEEMQEHIAGCPECANLLLDLATFVDPEDPADGQADREAAVAWQRLRPHLPPPPPSVPWFAARWRQITTSPATVYVLAASLMLSITAAPVWRLLRQPVEQTGTTVHLYLQPSTRGMEVAPIPRLAASRPVRLVLHLRHHLPAAVYRQVRASLWNSHHAVADLQTSLVETGLPVAVVVLEPGWIKAGSYEIRVTSVVDGATIDLGSYLIEVVGP